MKGRASMPVVFDPETPARLCRRGQHDLPDAEDFVYGTIFDKVLETL